MQNLRVFFVFVVQFISRSPAFTYRSQTSGRPVEIHILHAGFSKPNKIQKKNIDDASLPELNPEARKYMRKHKNDIDAASADYFRSQIDKFSQLQKSNLVQGHNPMLDGIDLQHEAKVAAAWNTVAIFLPWDYSRSKGKVESHVDRRLRHISSAIIHSPQILHRKNGSSSELPSYILDIGCGDGSLIPYLIDAQNSGASIRIQDYRGLDISSEMISLAQERWKNVVDKTQLIIGSFPRQAMALLAELNKSTANNSVQGYSVIVFNGSLQFFHDTSQVLKASANLLLGGGRIVLSHVNGDNFVKDECKKNPGIAVRSMPNNISLDSIAHDLGLKVIRKKDMGLKDYDASLDGDDRKFYLVVLEKAI